MTQVPNSKSHQVYGDQYGPNPNATDPNLRPQDPQAETINYEQQLFDEYGISEEPDYGSEDAAAYRQIEEGSPGADSPSENELFGDMNDEELVHVGRELAAQDDSGELSELEQGRLQLNTMLEEAENSSLPTSKKTSMIREIKDLQKKLEAGRLEDTTEIEDLRETFNQLVEENPSFAKRMLGQLSETGIECTEEQIKKALKDADISEEQISNIHLPADASTTECLLAFFKELDPHFAEIFESEPYGKDSMNQFSTFLKMTLKLKDPPPMAKVAEMLDSAVTVTWKGEELLSRISGSWAGEKRAASEALTRLVTTGQGQEAIHADLWSGHNDVERRHHVYNDIIRAGISNLYEVSGRNPYLLKRYLKMIPEQILRDLRDVVIAHSGELSEKHAGDLFTSQEIHDILDWGLAGGTPPMVLDSDLPAREISSSQGAEPQA